ncbi:MAG: non-hydrolyzing UDP-N-acetylglucosamine 2-epimerase [Anaerolineae bacterium]
MRIASVVGARPQFIKAAPVSRALQAAGYGEILVHTGQHYNYEMSQVFFDELGLKAPDYHLGVGSGTHGYQTGEMLKRVEEVLLKEKPDLVMVYGDTNTTLAGALAAAKLHIPVAHVEAGLRSFNRRMPEEINRVLTDHVSDLLFCPTQTAVENLRREGITEGVHRVGDVMYDAALLYLDLAERKSRILERLDLAPRSYALATVHRAENTDDLERLRAIFEGLGRIGREGLPVILPLHPRTRKQVEAMGFHSDSVQLMEPVSYLDMLVLEKNARVILTDSGGVQKEAFFFRVPCVTLREETEWVETVEAGWNVLVGCDPERIVRAALEARPGVESVWPYGDGRAAERIVNLVSGR